MERRNGSIGEVIVEWMSEVEFSASSWERRNLSVKGSRLVDSDMAASIIPPLGRVDAPERCSMNHFMMARS